MNTAAQCRSLQRRSKTCSTNSKRQSKAGCALGMFCRDSVWFFQRRETSRFRHRPKRRSMPRGRSLGTRFEEIFPNSERGDQKFVFIVRRMKKECKTCLIQQRPKRLALEGVSPLGEAYHWNSVADFERRVASAADIKSIYSRLCVH
jgi:hypothetical protein